MACFSVSWVAGGALFLFIIYIMCGGCAMAGSDLWWLGGRKMRFFDVFAYFTD